MKKDVSIQIIRIIAMFLILFCHFFNELQNGVGIILGQIFNVGVFIFLFISGYLFGKKDINDVKKWYKKRFVRIFIPVWIWALCINLVYIVQGKEISLIGCIAYLTNLQGFFGATEGLQHLWFLSLIMLCYIITPILNMIKRKIEYPKSLFIISIMCFVSYCISYVNVSFGRYLFQVMLYVFAFFYSYNEKKYSMKKIPIPVAMTIVLLLGGIRVITRKFFDDTVFYTNGIVLFTQSIIAILIFIIIKKIITEINNTKLLNIINHIDKISLYIYIVHYAFCVGPMDIIKSTGVVYIFQVMVVLLISWILAYILMEVTEIIVKKWILRDIVIRN